MTVLMRVEMQYIETRAVGWPCIAFLWRSSKTAVNALLALQPVKLTYKHETYIYKKKQLLGAPPHACAVNLRLPPQRAGNLVRSV